MGLCTKIEQIQLKTSDEMDAKSEYLRNTLAEKERYFATLKEQVAALETKNEHLTEELSTKNQK